jgi:uncharacterized tellurite resistance protein B-like protein
MRPVPAVAALEYLASSFELGAAEPHDVALGEAAAGRCIMSILDLLGLVRRRADEVTDTDAVRRIVASLDRLEPDRARYVAAFAYVLARVALADRVAGEEETRTMEALVRQHGQLPEEQAVIVVQMAKSQNRLFGGTEDFLVTREFERIATFEQKLALLDCLFAVSAAEGGIDTIEDNEIRRVAIELKIPHDEYVRVRVRHRQQLNVLRSTDDAGDRDRS